MIILDIETSGTDPRRHCMLSLGAVDYDTGEEFYGECSVYVDSEIDPVAMEINGFKQEDMQPGKKQTAHGLFHKFHFWAQQFPNKLLAGHNIGHLDILFLEHLDSLYTQYHLPWSFGYRTLDLHSVAYTVLGKSLSHENICKELGLPVEPKPHNALNGARSECAAFRELFKRMDTMRTWKPLLNWENMLAIKVKPDLEWGQVVGRTQRGEK